MPAISASAVGVILSMPRIFADCKGKRNRCVCSLREDGVCESWQTANMATDKNGGPNYLRAWREYRRMTQEELAAELSPPTTGSVISLLEDGERGLSLKWLRRLAPALRTRPGFIADFNPLEADTLTLELIESVPDDKKDHVLRIVRTFIEEAAGQ